MTIDISSLTGYTSPLKEENNEKKDDWKCVIPSDDFQLVWDCIAFGYE